MVTQGANAKRRGRPPASDSADTRRAILDNARRLFCDGGYSGVTNKDLAEAAGITTGALYHYVDSKLDLYVMVDIDSQRFIYDRFRDAVRGCATFLEMFDKVLDAAAEMHEEDPSLTRFVGTVRADIRYHPEIADRLASQAREREEFFFGLVEVGIATGEIEDQDRELVTEFIRVVLTGLTMVSTSARRYRRSVDSIKSVMRGQLVEPVADIG
ncbi:MAG: TetR/AcrR family transcriptional regulator [Acidimicrobiia bacterium]|nr:TetR/AcrR family transcriptional regulator [Acidimicrobiia bacterium]